MIATARFVFIHLPRTGGQFVDEFLMRFVTGARTIGHNLPRLLIPPEYSGLPVLGFVRNPWRFYVAWYDFQANLPWSNALFRVLSRNGRLGFEATVRNMLELGTVSEHLDRVIAALPAGYGGSGLNLPKFALAPIRGSRCGFYSHLYGYLYGDPDHLLHVKKVEELATELPAALEQFGERVTNAMHDYLLDNRTALADAGATHADAGAAPTDTGAAYVERYSDGLRDLVAERDAPIIAQHGYRFGD
jgi:hypothetical protein